MDGSIALILVQDGIVNGAIYALLALALVLVFTVTRVIFIPQGEFVTYGALTLAQLVSGKLPGTAWLLLGAGVIAFLMDVHGCWRSRRWSQALRAAVTCLILPAVTFLLVRWGASSALPLWALVGLTLLLVVPLGPIVYRIAYEPLAEATVLVLLIVSVGVHFAMTGLGLLFFGAEGSRTPAFIEGQLGSGSVVISGQSLFVVGASAILIGALYLFFDRTLYGKALRATAVNRRGARLMGISTTSSGRITFVLAALIGTLSGMLIAPITTIYYDSGFLIGLKGFVAAIIGGLVSYPAAAIGALLVGLLESFSSFWASAFKEVIVFTLIIPVLLWRSVASHVVEEEE
ncbi:MAG: branched-chain amino acid ABC transporter permease [Burkholderiaceae bacterium]|jgi:branched-chain amino acid transport system permease protein